MQEVGVEVFDWGPLIILMKYYVVQETVEWGSQILLD